MADAFALVIEGLNDLSDLENLDQKIIQSARIAVNRAATRGRTDMAKQVLTEINFPRDYVSPKNKRLYVSKNATNSTLEAVITARSRVTSLARFTKADRVTSRGRSGARVELVRGAQRFIPGAFLIRLRAGAADLDTKSNLGLAIRTPGGVRPDNAYAPKRLGKGLWLLYGPSVSQMIHSERNDDGIATRMSPEIISQLQAEFDRQMGL